MRVVVELRDEHTALLRGWEMRFGARAGEFDRGLRKVAYRTLVTIRKGFVGGDAQKRANLKSWLLKKYLTPHLCRGAGGAATARLAWRVGVSRPQLHPPSAGLGGLVAEACEGQGSRSGAQ